MSVYIHTALIYNDSRYTEYSIYLLQYKSHCMTSHIISHLAFCLSVVLFTALGSATRTSFRTKQPHVCLEDLLCLLYATLCPSPPAAGQVPVPNLCCGAPSESQQFHWHRGELHSFGSLLNNLGSLVLWYVYQVVTHCPMTYHLDLKYQENDEWRKDRNRPKNLCMVWAAGNLTQI